MGGVMKKRHHKLKSFTYLAFAVFVSVLLLSQVGTVRAGRSLMEMAQGETSQSDARGEAERVFDEAMKLYRQGTAESLRSSIEKWKEALKLFAAFKGRSGGQGRASCYPVESCFFGT